MFAYSALFVWPASDSSCIWRIDAGPILPVIALVLNHSAFSGSDCFIAWVSCFKSMVIGKVRDVRIRRFVDGEKGWAGGVANGHIQIAA